MSYPQELNISVDRPWGPFYFLSSQLLRERVRHIPGAAQGVLQGCWVCPLWESRAGISVVWLTLLWSHPCPALEPVSDLPGSISQHSPCNNRFAAFCMGISGWVLSGNPWTLLPDLGWSDTGAHFDRISLGDDFLYLSATVIKLFAKHLLCVAVCTVLGARCRRLSYRFADSFPSKMLLFSMEDLGAVDFAEGFN